MNNKLLTIKEFDKIICNKDYKDDSGYKYIDEKYFNEFERFICEFEAEKNNSSAMDFFQIYSRKGVGNVIQAKNYVGLVQLKSGYQIQILPKIDFDNDNTSKIFIKMLCSMKDFPGKVFNSANLQTYNMNLYEIFIDMYIRQVQELVKRGLCSAYTQAEDNLNFLRGKLLVNKHILKNIVHKEKFYAAYDEFSVNRVENRLIKSTLMKLQKLSFNQSNIKAVKQLLVYFEPVDLSVNYKSDFSKVIIDRNNNEYKDIMIWSKVFLLNESFTAFTGDTAAIALLFPMEKVYEAYVAKNIRRIFSEKEYNVSVQDREHYLFREGNRNVFSLCPDIVIRSNNKTIIMDTKWKRLINDSQKNYGISQTDMYQMFAYSKAYKARNIWLLYPKVEEMKNRRGRIVFNSKDKNTTVSVFFVDVANIDDSINTLKEEIKEKYN